MSNQAPTPDPLQSLRLLVSAPLSGGTQVDWQDLVAEYPHGFPDDYRTFMRDYGEGEFNNHLMVFPPVPDVYPHDPDSTVRGVTAEARYQAEEDEYDQPDLLVGWAMTVDSDLLCWRTTSSDPNEWTTVIWRRQWLEWMAFDFGMAEFLRRFAARDLPELWTFDLPHEGCRFLHAGDIKRLRLEGIDPWRPEPAAGS
ncbi:SMI1/KNR4 family protein [Actinacidiphila glaucinigra]|uniref:SMI1/KNR4 family protein n=1 Tax=Actinacidiphila glaucinigra TaxID=235986 RepID=UPI0035DAA4C6